MSLQKKCLTASAITHGLLVLLVFIGSAFIPQKPQIKGPEFEMFTLPPDFELVAQDNVLSGGSPDAAGGPKIKQPAEQPKVVTPPPQPKVEPQKIEIPPNKPVEPKPEPVKQVEPPKPKPEPDNFDFTKTKVIKAEPKKTELPKLDLSKAKTMKIPADSKNSKQPDTSARETQLAAARANQIAELRSNLEGNLSAGGKSGGRANVDDFLGPGGARTASYSLYLAGIYRQAWVAPSKSSASKVVRVKVTISKDGTVLSREVLDKSGDRDFSRAAESTVNRVKKFDRPPPTNEPSVTYTLEFVPPE